MPIFLMLQTTWRKANARGDISTAFLALLPVVLLFAIFNIYPLLYSGYLSVVEWDGLSKDRQYVGIDNYQAIIKDPIFRNSLEVTFKYAIGVTVLSVSLSLVIATLLNSISRGRTFYRMLYFIPVVTSSIAVAIVWKLLMSPGTGYADIFLRDIGIASPKPAWLRNPTWALYIVILVGTWKRLGFNIVIYMAGLQGIPKDYYEAATVDGAGALMRFWKITVPLISPITLLLVIMSIIDSFLIFDVVYVMTDGGPIGTTEVVGLLLYREAFRYFNLGTASALGWVIFAIVFIITLLQWRLFGVQESGS